MIPLAAPGPLWRGAWTPLWHHIRYTVWCAASIRAGEARSRTHL